jgi:phage pi2 protein 07
MNAFLYDIQDKWDTWSNTDLYKQSSYNQDETGEDLLASMPPSLLMFGI